MSSYQWEVQLSKVLQAGQSSVIILHGNVRDYFQNGDQFLKLKDYLFNQVLRDRDYQFFYDPQAGIQFNDPKAREDYFKSLQGYDAYHKTNFAQNPPKQPGPAFSLIENISKLRLIDKASVAGIINYLDQIVPSLEQGHLSDEMRYILVAIDKWAQNQAFLENNLNFFLIVENLAKIDESITRNPFIPLIFIEHPNEENRVAFVNTGKTAGLEVELSNEAIGKLTSGLNLIQISRLFAYLKANKMKLTMEALKELKKQFIEAECYGLLEFVEPKFNLEYIAGHTRAKKMLRDSARAIARGKTRYLPMGYLICGPVGTGKTFLTSCFAGEVGIPVVKFLNFRSQWQGATEANLEKILNLLKAIHPVVVMIDEADAFLGNRNIQGDSGTSSRIFASLAAFMGDTTYRGKIIWFLMTSRPDLLPIDLKRQGRAEEHIALFHAQNDAEEEALFQALSKKNKIDADGLRFVKARDQGQRFSGADIEAIIVRARLQSQLDGEEKLSQKTLTTVAQNFLSPNYPVETELQIMIAIRECTNKTLIPENYQKMVGSDVTTKINELKSLLKEY